MIIILIFFIYHCLTTNLFSQESDQLLKLTLTDCEELALKNNFSVQSARLGLKTSKAKLIQASHTKYLPKIELRNVWGPIPRARGIQDPETGFVTSPDTSTSIPGDLRFFTQLDVDIIQPIYTFGKIKALSNAATYGVEAGQANLDGKSENVRFQVRQLYWGLILGKEILSVVQNIKKELKKAEDKIEEKLDEGSDDVSQTDLFKLQIFRYDINKRLREAVDKITLTKSALKSTLGLNNDVVIEIATEYLEPINVQFDDLPVYYDLALQNRSEVARLRAGLNAKRALIQVSKSDYYPQFFLGGQIKYNYARDRFDPTNPFVYNPTNYFRPGIVLGMNLNLNWVQTRDKVRVAQAEYLELAQKEKALMDGLRLDVQKSYLELVQAEKNMKDSRKALKSSDNWLRSVTMTFDIGVGEVKELIDAFKANAAMQAEHFQNIFKFNVAVAKLSKATGRDLLIN